MKLDEEEIRYDVFMVHETWAIRTAKIMPWKYSIH